MRLAASVILIALGAGACTSTPPALVSFRFEHAHNPDVPRDIDGAIAGDAIAVDLPYIEDPTALIATFEATGTVTVGGTAQQTGVTANDFSRPVTYAVTTPDGKTASYTIDVSIRPFAAPITDYGLASAHNPGLSEDAPALIDGFEINASVEHDTDLHALVATFATTGTVTIGGALQASGTTANDFGAIVSYRVDAGDGTHAHYHVHVVPSPYRRHVDLPLPHPARAIAAGDLDADGRPDLVVATGLGTIEIYVNQTAPGVTTPSFADPIELAAGKFLSAIAIGDLDGDHRPDLVVADQTGAGALIVLNTTTTAGAPTFASPSKVLTGYAPASVALGDLDGDHRLDIVVANMEDDTVSILPNLTEAPGALVLGPKKDVRPGPSGELLSPAAVTLVDLDRDGALDLVVALARKKAITVLRNDSATAFMVPAFAAPVPFATDADPFDVAAADFDHDGKADLASGLVAGSHQISVLHNNSTNALSLAASVPAETAVASRESQALAVADLDGDGSADVLVTGDPITPILYNRTPTGSTTPLFAPPIPLAGGPYYAHGTVLADLDGDGATDIALAGPDAIAVLLAR